MVKLDSKQGEALIRLARRSIAAKLDVATAEIPGSDLEDPAFREQRGTFVTLKIKGKLRGCIGSLTAHESILEGIQRNACNAAFNDLRFPPLSAEELPATAIEVSILTDAKPLAFTDGRDLITKLRPHIDGVIIRHGSAGATFLPQVWEQLPRPEDFLNHLCMKAMLPQDSWSDPAIKILTYQVQCFHENK